jgi:superfamily II DNA helicase RecQ
MPYKFFIIPILHGEEAEREFNAFLAGHRNLQVDKDFVANGQQSFWAVSVAYASTSSTQTEGKSAAYEPKVKYEEEMSGEQFDLYTELRELRNEIAEANKVPAYKIFNDAELASMAREMPDSIAGLRKIRGIGKAKTDAHGEVFLEKLRKARNAAASGVPAPVTDEEEGRPF